MESALDSKSFITRASIAPDNYFPNANGMGQFTFTQMKSMNCSNIVEINRNATWNISMPKVTTSDKHVMEQAHSLPVSPVTFNNEVMKSKPCPPGYITLHESNCTFGCGSDALTSESFPVDSDKITCDFNSNDIVGKLSPTGHLHFLDKIDVSTMLKPSDASGMWMGEHFDVSQWKWRVGLLEFTECPAYNVKMMYQVGWVSKEAYKDIFGIDYYEELPDIKQTDVIKVQYPQPSYNQNVRSKRYNQRSLPVHNTLSGPHVSSIDPFTLYSSPKMMLCAKPTPEIRKRMPTVDIANELSDYMKRPVQSVNSPIYKAVMRAKHDNLLTETVDVGCDNCHIQTVDEKLLESVSSTIPRAIAKVCSAIIKETDILEDVVNKAYENESSDVIDNKHDIPDKVVPEVDQDPKTDTDEDREPLDM